MMPVFAFTRSRTSSPSASMSALLAPPRLRRKLQCFSETCAAPFVRPRQPASSIKRQALRSEEHTSELQSLMRISYAGFSLTKTSYMPNSATAQTQTNTAHHTSPPPPLNVYSVHDDCRETQLSQNQPQQ